MERVFLIIWIKCIAVGAEDDCHQSESTKAKPLSSFVVLLHYDIVSAASKQFGVEQHSLVGLHIGL